ncbi:MAG: DUF6206 family protein [Paracoccaceae bacterium]|nr:DUF6206 family protein [Paracoccaceae bacterium]
MYDLEALKALILADQTLSSQPISKLGYFCQPFRPKDGPFSDCVVKVYRGLKNHVALRQLEVCHSDYLAVLHQTGVPVPETAFYLLEFDCDLVPVIVQQALPEQSMMRAQMLEAQTAQAVTLLEAGASVIADFWNNLNSADPRVGFHPSIRNFAIVEGRAIFFDTFPPLIHYDRIEMGRILLQFSKKPLIRVLGPFVRGTVTSIQDEWYSPAETFVGLVGSACRLRPEDRTLFLDWGTEFVTRRMPRWADEAQARLQAPPRLPGYWTAMRKLLGLQGAPNV